MRIKFIKTGGWEDVKESALTTISKSSIEGKEISSEWKKNILRSEHSPIRELTIKFKLLDLKRWIAGQLVRHNVGVNNFMGTMRPDRGTNLPRSEQTMETPTELMQSYNAQSFTTYARTRLCRGCVSKETREATELIVDYVSDKEPELAFYCVPPCIYRGACKEVGFTKCNYFKNFVESIHPDFRVDVLTDIDKRYQAYHDWKK